MRAQGAQRGQHSRADDHAARVLAKVPRQISHALAQIEITRNAWMPDIEPSLFKMLGHRVIRSAPFPVPDKSGQALNRLTVKAQRLTYLTRSRASRDR